MIPQYCLMVRQYVVMTNSSVGPEFKSVKDMKSFFREAGYTYSRIASDPTVRVFMKE